MQFAAGKPGVMDVALAILLGTGCVLALPIYWWLLVKPILHLLKRTRSQSDSENFRTQHQRSRN